MIAGGVLGIDIGKAGGIALVGTNQQFVMPPISDSQEFGELIRRYEPAYAGIEAPFQNGSMGKPRCSQCGQFPTTMGPGQFARYMEAFGLLLGALESHGVPTIRIEPRVWKKTILLGSQRSDEDAAKIAARLFPWAELTPGRCVKPQRGLVRALCIAEYTRRRFDAEALAVAGL